MTNIVVLGAGVIGLTTALQLKRAIPSSNITVLGQHIPGDLDIDYTSPFAGANWHSFATDEEIELQNYDAPGYTELVRLAENEPTSGIVVRNSISYYTQNALDEIGGNTELFLPWFKEFVEGFEIIDKGKYPEGIVYGFQHKGVVISVSIYLNYLLAQNISLGTQVKRSRRVHSLAELKTPNTDLVINATGLLAHQLQDLNDSHRNFPVRGQTLLVRNTANACKAVSGFKDYPKEMLYIMPRKEGGSIIGGCFEVGSSDPEPNTQLTARILERATKYAPELLDPHFQNNPSQFEIVRVNVGLRPFRDGGARIEVDSERKWLIHNYGAGGGGYQGSYGMADKVVELVKDIFPEKSKL